MWKRVQFSFAAALIGGAIVANGAMAATAGLDDITFEPTITLDNGLRISVRLDIEGSAADSDVSLNVSDIVFASKKIDLPRENGEFVSFTAATDPKFGADASLELFLKADTLFVRDGDLTLDFTTPGLLRGESAFEFKALDFLQAFDVGDLDPNVFFKPDIAGFPNRNQVLGDDVSDTFLLAFGKGSVAFFAGAFTAQDLPIPTAQTGGVLTPDDVFVLAAASDVAPVPLPPAAPALLAAFGLIAWRARRRAKGRD